MRGLVLAAVLGGAASAGEVRQVDAVLIDALKAAQAVVRESGDGLWPGYAAAPFGFVLVEADREVLLCDDRMPEGFSAAQVAAGLDCPQAVGPTSWRQASLLAAMPVFGPPSVIVMGSPEATGLETADWQRTIFHEHFHQWQAEQPGYYARVAALDLADGDETGMWMLNFPFPYSEPKVVSAFAEASKALAAALDAKDDQLAEATRAYQAARAKLAASVSAKAWRYFEFQLWQEGVARWTEIALAGESGDAAMVSAADAARARIREELEAPDLATAERVAVYAFGAGEAMLLERIRPGWRACYNRQMALGPLLSEGCM